MQPEHDDHTDAPGFRRKTIRAAVRMLIQEHKKSNTASDNVCVQQLPFMLYLV